MKLTHHESFMTHREKVVEEWKNMMQENEEENLHKEAKPFIKRNNMAVMSYLMYLTQEEVMEFWKKTMMVG